MLKAISFRRTGTSFCASIFSLLTLAAISPAADLQVERVPVESHDHPASLTPANGTPRFIVVGFVGGFIKHDDPVHAEVQLATRLRKAYPAGVDVETFESYRGENARTKILSLLDANHDGTLTSAEKQNAHIILYGHSWGASEAIAVARELEKDGIPVLLTIQVDSISKIGHNDTVIPANVAQAANFFQTNGFVRGQPVIRAADPKRTRIIGNFRFDYKASPYTCNEYPWYDHIFVKPHTQIECDPNVWKQAEDLIRADLPPATSSDSRP